MGCLSGVPSPYCGEDICQPARVALTWPAAQISGEPDDREDDAAAALFELANIAVAQAEQEAKPQPLPPVATGTGRGGRRESGGSGELPPSSSSRQARAQPRQGPRPERQASGSQQRSAKAAQLPLPAVSHPFADAALYQGSMAPWYGATPGMPFCHHKLHRQHWG